MKVLNLYAGIGGNRKLWTDCEVTAVEYDPKIAAVYQMNFPDDKVIVGDAHEYLIENMDKFDFIWASPPCPSHSKLQTMIVSNTHRITYPDMRLYQEVIVLQNWHKGKYCIENVIPYYEPLIKPTAKLHRHIYWANFRIGNFKVTDDRKHTEIKPTSTVYGFNVANDDLEDMGKTLRNMVDPELGLYIFNCARNIITKSNTKQISLFDELDITKN